jgi:hypothetical protein
VVVDSWAIVHFFLDSRDETNAHDAIRMNGEKVYVVFHRRGRRYDENVDEEST